MTQTTAHLPDDRFYAATFDQTPPTPQEAAHLVDCPACRQQLHAVSRLFLTLTRMRHGLPSPAAFDRFAQLFDQAPVQPGGWQGFIQEIRGRLVWDSRLRPAFQGVRGVAHRPYRLLYATDHAEIELMVTPRAARFDVEGEVVTSYSLGARPPLLIQLQHRADPTAIYETESGPHGRFRLEGILPGNYNVWVSPTAGALLVWEGLEIE
ncbi:MAG: hypothetical protein KJZ93_15325 [Caldilineaceae bacterium]|nr:hypothetical protein [Caldilineaceae bacterium]